MRARGHPYHARTESGHHKPHPVPHASRPGGGRVQYTERGGGREVPLCAQVELGHRTLWQCTDAGGQPVFPADYVTNPSCAAVAGSDLQAKLNLPVPSELGHHPSLRVCAGLP